MRLYFFQQDGIVKAGITKNDDVIPRLKQIKCSISSKQNVVDFEHLNPNNDGSTEFFISNQEKIKECVTLFCVSGYLKKDLNALQQLNNIQDFPLEMLKEKYPVFLELCEKSKKNNNTNIISTISLKEAFDKATKLPKKINFIVENNQFYLTINDDKINVQELIQDKNSFFLDKLLSNDSDIILEKNNKENLYLTIQQLREKNFETSLQPLIAINKEMKAERMNSFLKNGGLEQLKELMAYFDGSNIGTLDANELLSSMKSGIIGYFNYLTEENILSSTQTNKLKQYLDKIGNIHEINWDSPQVFSNYFKFIEKCDFLSEEERQNIVSCAKSYAGIYKILYHSKDKQASLELITDFFNHAQNVLNNGFNTASTKKLASFLNKNPEFWQISDDYFSIGVEPQYKIDAKLQKIQKHKFI